jgi:hypothetical protein
VPLVTPARESRLTIAPHLGQQNVVEISLMILGWPLRRSDVQSQYASEAAPAPVDKRLWLYDDYRGLDLDPPLSESGMLVVECRRREASPEKKSV